MKYPHDTVGLLHGQTWYHMSTFASVYKLQPPAQNGMAQAINSVSVSKQLNKDKLRIWLAAPFNKATSEASI